MPQTLMNPFFGIGTIKRQMCREQPGTTALDEFPQCSPQWNCRE